MLLDALVASTVHDTPPRAAVRVDPDNEQIPDVTCHDTAPPDWPPDAVSDSDCPVVNDDALVIANPFWVAFVTVTVVFDDDTTR